LTPSSFRPYTESTANIPFCGSTKNTWTSSTMCLVTTMFVPSASKEASNSMLPSMGDELKNWYLGRITSTRFPSSLMARASAVTTSPKPPTLAMGAISTAMCAMCSGGFSTVESSTGKW
jgi:hypothetical protein